ncbi:MAG: multicopper oxidase domain-containing protein [Bacteroidia bacterium]
MRTSIISIFLLLSQVVLAQIDKDFFLIARNTGEKQLADSSIITVFGFAEDLSTHPSIPGPTLIMNEGDSVEIDLWNVSQGAPHTIHLHGLDVDQENDGVPSLSFEVLHMDHGFYRFEAPHAGTYLYHCHVVSTIHVQAGMYGLIIVKEKNNEKKTWTDGYDYDREFAFLNSEIDTVWHRDSVLDHPHGDTVTLVAIPPYHPQFFLVNGYSDQQLIDNEVKVYGAKNEAIYLRLANVGYYGNTFHFPPELDATIIASDGRPLPQSEQSDSIVILPGERYGVMLYPTDTLNSQISVDYFNLNSYRTEGNQFLEVNILETASKEEQINIEPLVYPNPFTSHFSLELGELGQNVTGLQIAELNGKVVWETKVQDVTKIESVDLRGLNSGIYILQIATSDGSIFIKKLVKL